MANAGVGVDAELAEEADEERLAHAEPVDRERDEHDEEEQRPEHDVRAAATRSTPTARPPAQIASDPRDLRDAS